MDPVGIFGILGGAAAVLTWLDFAPNGPHIVAKIKEQWTEPRRRLRELEESVHTMGRTLDNLQKDLADVATVRMLAGFQSELDRKLEDTERKHDALRREVEKLRKENSELVTRNVNLEQELSAISAEHGQALKDLDREVRGNLAELGEALRVAENPSGALVERLARDRARTGASAPSSDAPRGR